MALLGAKNYDPTGGAAVSKATSALLAMTAIDTTNLRITFTAPANGAVLVRLRGTIHGATTFPQILLGVLDGATIRGRQAPIGALNATALATSHLSQEALYVVTGLTPGNSYTWDAAYAVQAVVASTGLKYGGPDDTTTDNAFGGFAFEIWEAPTLLAGIMYDPAAAVAKSTTSRVAMTAFDITNLRNTFTAPSSGAVWVRIRTVVFANNTTFPQILLGVLESTTIKGRQSPIGGLLGTAAAATRIPVEASFVVSGLTPGNSYSWDAAYGIEILLSGGNIEYGGPDNNSGANAWGGLSFEIWTA